MNISFSRIREHIRARAITCYLYAKQTVLAFVAASVLVFGGSVPTFPYVKQTVLAFVAASVIVIGGNVPTFAQTPVPLEFNGAVNTMFTSANSWMTTLAPVLSIGFGILIALAVLGLVGWLIVSALQSAKKGMK